jgi:hypothetical protein
MNDNAFSKKSSIKVKTKSGKIPDNVGFSRTDGSQMPLEDQLKEMEKNGLLVERTPNGIFITKNTDTKRTGGNNKRRK